MKYAKWTSRVLTNAISPTRSYQLRVGKRGTGRLLGGTRCWTDSHLSMAEADAICHAIELRAQAQGYIILAGWRPALN